MGLNLPIAFGDPLHFENDTLFSHDTEYGGIAQGRKPKVICLIQNDDDACLDQEVRQ
jgi:hypothetical protein